jgi:Dynein heavy chain AAA lid domain
MLDSFLRKLASQSLTVASAHSDFGLAGDITLPYPAWKLAASLPGPGTVFDFCFHVPSLRWVPWSDATVLPSNVQV